MILDLRGKLSLFRGELQYIAVFQHKAVILLDSD